MIRYNILTIFLVGSLLSSLESTSVEKKHDNQVYYNPNLYFINTAFENASPVTWEIAADSAIVISLIYDYERSSSNRANGHWFFLIQARPGSDLTIILQNFDNIWNGKRGSPISKQTSCYISPDKKTWKAIPARKTEDNRLELNIHMEQDELFVARLEPYTLNDLQTLIKKIKMNPLVQIYPIGYTVEGRPLEIIRLGYENAPFRILLRARAHPWESGGNWVLQGLIKSLLKKDELSQRCLQKYCVYLMPMANKDGVVHGKTRFNLSGMDLNRNWDLPADSMLAPENYALETWLKTKIYNGEKPHLAIDFHNDNSGLLHKSHPTANSEQYMARMERLENLLYQNTWFTEGSAKSSFRNPGTFGEGLTDRFGIDALVYELNCDWIAGLNKVPYGKDWELLGENLRKVFLEYFEAMEK